MQIDTSRDRPALKAVLGPTNTGKTHLAMERMLAHESGVIGFPLRLLARENYDRAVREKGKNLVALVTGEEKIVPPGARYFLTTVESMPTDQAFAFVAIDEVQLCADPERGHVFTERLLHARGTAETMFMGADTVRPIIQKLIPDVEFISRPRLSTLVYTGHKKLTRLKARSCIVAFSANDVYAIAELIRRTSGGAAIVMGALSPRTRNAQVDMFQSGEVDTLVATDAVGMGLNMDVDHVALAATRKFDGRGMRDLTPAELAQIAGRAGRHMNDGTFGTTGDIGGLASVMTEAITNHTFRPLKKVFWRNTDLDFRSIKALKESLAQKPESDVLVLAREADDERALTGLGEDKTIADMSQTADGVQTLWDVCRVPDFSRISNDAHRQLLAKLFHYLMAGDGHIPAAWAEERIKRIDRMDGDIDTLMARISAVRTWTFISHQGKWLDNTEHWQARTRDIEDRLSDALHEKLTARFVDQRTSRLARSLKADQPLATELQDDGALEVEGHHLGHLSGFRFVADRADTSLAAKVLDTAATKALRQRITERLELFAADVDGAFTFTADGLVNWRGEAVARLGAGSALLVPAVKVLASDLLDAKDKDRIAARLGVWVKDMTRDRLGPLLAASEAPLDGVARGLVFRLGESLGALPRHEAEAEIKALDRETRRDLRRLGVRIGRHLVYIPALLRPGAVELSVLLWALHTGETPMAPPPAGRVSLKREHHQPEGWLRAAGFRPAGGLFVRADMLERIAEAAWKKLEKAPFTIEPDLLSLAGCSTEEMAGILKTLGFQADTNELYKPQGRGGNKLQKRSRPQHQGKVKKGGDTGNANSKTKRQKNAPKRKPVPQKHEPKIDPDSPFAKLKDLKLTS